MSLALVYWIIPVPAYYCLLETVSEKPRTDGNLQGTQKFHMRERPETGFSAESVPALNYACGRGKFRDDGRFIGTKCDA